MSILCFQIFHYFIESTFIFPQFSLYHTTLAASNCTEPNSSTVWSLAKSSSFVIRTIRQRTNQKYKKRKKLRFFFNNFEYLETGKLCVAIWKIIPGNKRQKIFKKKSNLMNDTNLCFQYSFIVSPLSVLLILGIVSDVYIYN